MVKKSVTSDASAGSGLRCALLHGFFRHLFAKYHPQVGVLLVTTVIDFPVAGVAATADGVALVEEVLPIGESVAAESVAAADFFAFAFFLAGMATCARKGKEVWCCN